MSQTTGHQPGIGYDLPPIGTAEIRAREGDATEFGLPAGYVDLNEYHGKTPPCGRVIGVGRS
ncbi:hypothetical protein GCM10010533_51450 [Mycolicibacterium pallens]